MGLCIRNISLPLLSLATICLSLLTLYANSQTPTRNINQTDNFLGNMNTQHPRLYLTATSLRTLKSNLSNQYVKSWYNKLENDAESILVGPLSKYDVVGGRLLNTSRDALWKISTLAGLYNLDHDSRKLDWVRRELQAIVQFPDWHPQHFLDTAEMTNAVSIGYDWLYNYLSSEERIKIRESIVSKGLIPALDAYNTSVGWWSRDSNNWNLVCNGGILSGAIAVADQEPVLANTFISKSLASLKKPMSSFAPDGGWIEGPTYWSYATLYNTYYIAALKTALQNDFGLIGITGFNQTGFFRIYTTGPTNLQFNFADAWEGTDPAPQMFWLATTFNQPRYQVHEVNLLASKKLRGLNIFHLLWFTPSLMEKTMDLPLNRVFSKVAVASLRNSWQDPNAIFLGAKGGNNNASHGHLDLGSFILDAQGIRWASDPGAGDYNLPGYFGKDRFTYFPTSTIAHNTISIDDKNQNEQAQAPISDYTGEINPRIVINLKEAYPQDLQSYYRTFKLIGQQQVMVQDDIIPLKSVNLVWHFHTYSKALLSNEFAQLQFKNKTLHLKIISPANSKFSLNGCNGKASLFSLAPANMQDLRICLPNQSSPAKIAVLIAP